MAWHHSHVERALSLITLQLHLSYDQIKGMFHYFYRSTARCDDELCHLIGVTRELKVFSLGCLGVHLMCDAWTSQLSKLNCAAVTQVEDARI